MKQITDFQLILIPAEVTYNNFIWSSLVTPLSKGPYLRQYIYYFYE